MVLLLIKKCQLIFLESSVYRSDRDLTEEDYIADINKNWYIHMRALPFAVFTILFFFHYIRTRYICANPEFF